MRLPQLAEMTIRRDDGTPLTHSTLVEGWSDILHIAVDGKDGVGRRILSMGVTLPQGTFTYTPGQLVWFFEQPRQAKQMGESPEDVFVPVDYSGPTLTDADLRTIHDAILYGINLERIMALTDPEVRVAKRAVRQAHKYPYRLTRDQITALTHVSAHRYECSSRDYHLLGLVQHG